MYPVSDPQLVIDSHTFKCTSPSALSSGATSSIYLFDAYIPSDSFHYFKHYLNCVYASASVVTFYSSRLDFTMKRWKFAYTYLNTSLLLITHNSLNRKVFYLFFADLLYFLK